MEEKTLDKQLDEKVEEILATNTVSRAQEVMGSKKGLWFIAFVSFLESATPLPIVTDPFMMAAILINRANYLKAIVVTTVASVVGGVAAYFTALFFLDVALDLLSADAAYTLATMTASESENIFILSLLGAFPPVPYTLTAWAVGVMKGGLIPFIAASIIGRGARYYIVGWLTYRFGPMAVARARRSIGITSIILIVLAGIFFWYKM